MNHYTILSITCITISILLTFVYLVIEPKKKTAAWYLIIILICVLALLAFIFLILHNKQELKLRSENKNDVSITKIMTSSISPRKKIKPEYVKEIYDVPKDINVKEPEEVTNDPRTHNQWFYQTQNLNNTRRYNSSYRQPYNLNEDRNLLRERRKLDNYYRNIHSMANGRYDTGFPEGVSNYYSM